MNVSPQLSQPTKAVAYRPGPPAFPSRYLCAHYITNDTRAAKMAAPAPPAGAGAGTTPCALSPALATPTAVIDYTTSAGAKLWKTNTEALPNKYDGSAAKLRVFIADVQRRAQTAGRAGITTITVDNAQRDLFKEYGVIELKHIHAAGLQVFTANNRSTQNSAQMYTFLFDSISETLKARLLTRQSDYVIGADQRDGPSLFKTILSIAKVHTRSTASHVRQALMSLDTYMKETAKCDVIKFNQYVQECRDDLASYGETSTDLLLYLFKGYQATTDAEFNRYIRDKQNAYNEGTDITVTTLMANAELKYKTLTQANTWCAPSAEQQQIVALQLQLLLMAQAAEKRPGNWDGGPDAKKRKFVPLPDDHWKYKNPKKEDTKVHNNKTYYWCPNHKKGMWVLHHPKDCRLKRQSGPSSNPTAAPTAPTPSADPHAAFAAVLQNYLNDE